MSVTRADVIARYPEFSDPTKFPLAQFNLVIAEASKQVSPEIWETQTNDGIMAKTAEKLFLGTTDAGGVGAVRRIKTDALEREFSQVGVGQPSNIYEKIFNDLKKGLLKTPIFV
jgi:hypothetical protein